MEDDQQRLTKEDIFFDEIIWLNINEFQLRKINEFPWDDLELKKEYVYFLFAIQRNYFSNSIVSIRKLFYDDDKDFFTIKKFKNEIVQELKDENERTLLGELFREIKPIEKSLNKMKEKVDLMRNMRLAHLSNKLFELGHFELNFSIAELTDIVKLLNDYYKLLKKYGRQGSEIIHLPLEYLNNRNTDIERVLDKIASDCKFLHMKEMDPAKWKRITENWEEKGVKQRRLRAINDYRKRLYGWEEVE